MRYTHTNLVARDWRRLCRFYQEVFACVPVPPERSISEEWLARGTGVPGAALEGQHLRLPGLRPEGPTLEIFSYRELVEAPLPVANRVGWGHLAFHVEDIPATQERLVAAGGERLGELIEREVPGVGRLAFTYARDPEGNLVELQRWEFEAGPSPAQVLAPAESPPPPLAVREAYDLWAGDYDQDRNPTRDLDALVLRSLLPELESLRVLEIGCGTGKNTLALVKAAQVVGLDLSPGMLARAKTRLETTVPPPIRERITLLQHDLSRGLPFQAESFDLVTFDLVLEHLEDLGAVFAEVARVLAPGGRVLVIEYHPFRQLQGKGADFSPPGSSQRQPVESFPHSLSEYLAAVRAAGLRLEALEEWSEEARTGPMTARIVHPGEIPRLLSLVLHRD